VKKGDRVRFIGKDYNGRTVRLSGRTGTVKVVGRGSGVTTGQCEVSWDATSTHVAETSWEPFAYKPTIEVINAVDQLAVVARQFIATEQDVGRAVVYVPYPGAQAEDGTITSVNDDYVFVRYAGDNASKATRPEDLQWLSP